MTVWVVVNDRTLFGRPVTLYWTGSSTGVANLEPFRPIGAGVMAADLPPSQLATWPTKEAATAAFIAAGGILAGPLRVVELADTGPPGRDGEGGPKPANVESVGTTPPNTNNHQPPPSDRRTADYGTADRRKGGKTPKLR